MKALALLLLLLFPVSATARGRIVQSSMGGDIDITDAPDGASLRTMGGDITITSARGHVVAKTMGGDIRVRRMDGSIEAGTMGGSVEIEVVRNGEIEIHSMGGHIELTLPANFSGSFDVELEQDDDGPEHEIISDFPLQIRKTMKDNWFRPDTVVLNGTGKSGSGANRVKITTIGGDIRIRRK